MKNILIVFLFLGMIACNQEVDEYQATPMQTEPSYALRHMVFLNIKPDLSAIETEKLYEAINKLGTIPQVHDYRLGTFTDLKDQRAFSEYEIMFEMAFENEEAYQIYQQSEIHLKLKSQLGPYLEGPPATYDLRDVER